MTIIEHLAKLEQLKTLKDDWDSYGSPPPSPLSINLARDIILKAEQMKLPVRRVLPSCEGVFLLFAGTQNIEVFNDGEILAAVTHPDIHVFDVLPDVEGAIRRVSVLVEGPTRG